MNSKRSIGIPAATVFIIAALALGYVLGRATSSPETPSGTPLTPAVAVSTGRAASSTEPLNEQVRGVPDVRQSTGYSCGASALQAVLAYWGTAEREDRLIGRLNTTPDQGTHPDDILRVAREFGLEAEIREDLDLRDLEDALGQGSTVIVDLQAWRDDTTRPWADRWDDGHYMVLIGMDAGNLYFEDPSLLGSRGFIPRPEFLERWHDYEGAAPLDSTDRKYVRMAIFLRGNKAAPPPPLLKVD